MSLSPFDSFQSRFVTYLLNRPHIIYNVYIIYYLYYIIIQYILLSIND